MLYRTILCATDGLPHSDRALQRAGELARENRAELRVLHIDEAHRMPPAVGGEYLAEQRALRAQRARHVREQISEISDVEPATPVIPHIVPGQSGSLAVQIARYGDRLDVDLIVIGSRGRGPFGGAFAGSTAQRLPHETERPVLILAGGPLRRDHGARRSLRRPIHA